MTTVTHPGRFVLTVFACLGTACVGFFSSEEPSTLHHRRLPRTSVQDGGSIYAAGPGPRTLSMP